MMLPTRTVRGAALETWALHLLAPLALVRLLAPLALVVGLLLLVTTPVQANGVPQLVKLDFIEGVSNWGPEDAEGVLEFSFAEGILALEVVGLPRLVGQAYEGWLVRSSSNEAISVGQFNAATNGTAKYEVQLPPISDYSLDLFIITVESLADATTAPSQNRSIGGFFSVLQPQTTEPSRNDTGSFSGTDDGTGPSLQSGSESGASAEAANEASAGASGQPGRLPETGDSESLFANVRGIALILVGAASLSWAAIRTRRRLQKGDSA